MSPSEIVVLVVGSVLTGGVGLRLVERLFSNTDNSKKETAALKRLEVSAEESIREELRKVEADLRATVRQAEQAEAQWRTQYFEAIGFKQASETELAVLKPKLISYIQQNQVLIAENETLKLKAGRRLTDQTTDTLYRIEEMGHLAADKAQHVASELDYSQKRADAVSGQPGESADAASRSRREEA